MIKNISDPVYDEILENKIINCIINRIKFKDLPSDCKKYFNGKCGGKSSILKVPQFIFTASCEQHDWNYSLGGNEADRLKADYQFYEAMVKDADKNPFYLFWAWVYYLFVRKFGKKYFTYRKGKYL